VPTSVITGDIGVSPVTGAYMTGFVFTADSSNEFATSVQIDGKAYAADFASPTPSKMTTAILDMQTAYTDASSRVNPNFTEYEAGLLAGKTLVPGLYKWTSDLVISGDVTIKGGANDTWIFQTTGSVNLAGDKKVILNIGSLAVAGPLAKNIVWVIAGEMVVGTGAHMEGILLVKTAAHFRTGASFNGRALAQTAVTLQMNTIKKPSA
jgi:hypothetical protein